MKMKLIRILLVTALLLIQVDSISYAAENNCGISKRKALAISVALAGVFIDLVPLRLAVQELIYYCAFNGYTKTARTLWNFSQHYKLFFASKRTKFMSIAIDGGHLDTALVFFETDQDLKEDHCGATILEILACGRLSFCTRGVRSFMEAAKSDESKLLTVANFLLEHKAEITPKALKCAEDNGYLLLSKLIRKKEKGS